MKQLLLITITICTISVHGMENNIYHNRNNPFYDQVEVALWLAEINQNLQDDHQLQRDLAEARAKYNKYENHQEQLSCTTMFIDHNK